MNKCELRWHRGAVIEIPLDCYFAYGLLLRPYYVSFFDKKYVKPIVDVRELESVPILFTILIEKNVVYDRRWKIVGHLPIKDEYDIFPMRFMYDEDGDRLFLVNPNTGVITPCTKDDIDGLEMAHVWWDTHVEDRLNAYFLGTHDCQWMQTSYDLFGRYVP